MIERDLGIPFDMPSPIGELESISEFVLGILSTPEEVRNQIASHEGAWPASISDDELSPRLHRAFLTRVNTTMLAPIAIHVLRAAWDNVPSRGLLPDGYARLEPGIIAMDEAFGRGRLPRDPFSNRALAVYHKFSPRVAMALVVLLQATRGPRNAGSTLWSFPEADLDAFEPGRWDHVRRQPPVLTDLLPQPVGQPGYL